jgi:hypothetical protein
LNLFDNFLSEKEDFRLLCQNKKVEEGCFFTMRTFVLGMEKAQKAPIGLLGRNFIWMPPRMWLFLATDPVF